MFLFSTLSRGKNKESYAWHRLLYKLKGDVSVTFSNKVNRQRYTIWMLKKYKRFIEKLDF